MKQKLFTFLVVLFVLIAFTPTLYELKRSADLPPDRSFELVHNYITDYNFYLSRIREGWDGRWTVIERYTNEPHDGSLIQEFYLLLGHAGRMIPYPNEAVVYIYYAACFVGSVLLLVMTVWAVTRIFPIFFWSVLAFLLAVVASGWPIIVPIGVNSWRFGGYMSWYTVMDTIQRMAFLPHVVVGQAMIIFLLFAANDKKTAERTGNQIFLGLIALLLGMIFPPGLIFVGVGLAISMVLDTIWNFRTYAKVGALQHWFTECVLPRSIIGLISTPALIYYYHILTLYPWKRLVDFNQLHPLSTTLFEYVMALGPVLPLGIFGLLVSLWRKEKQMITIASWVISWIALYCLFTFIPEQSPLRFAEMAPHIPLAFLTVYLGKTILEFVQKRKNLYYIGVVAVTVPFVCIVLGFGVLYSNWLWYKDFVNQKVGAGWPIIPMNNYIVYPSKAFMDGILFINFHTPPNSVVLSHLTAGNYIPALTGRRVYVGHDNSINKEIKVELVQQFFHEDMKPKDAYAWLKREGVTLVFYGPQEKEYIGAEDIATYYPFLQQIFSNTDVTIYQIP